MEYLEKTLLFLINKDRLISMHKVPVTQQKVIASTPSGRRAPGGAFSMNKPTMNKMEHEKSKYKLEKGEIPSNPSSMNDNTWNWKVFSVNLPVDGSLSQSVDGAPNHLADDVLNESENTSI